MAFADLLKSDLEGAILGSNELEEAITYHSRPPSGPDSTQALKAIVEVDSPDEPIQVGVSTLSEEPAIVITISKTTLPKVYPGRDEVTHRSLALGVRRVLRDDPVAWRLYCVG